MKYLLYLERAKMMIAQRTEGLNAPMQVVSDIAVPLVASLTPW